MYERSLFRNLGRIKDSAGVLLLSYLYSACLGYNLSDCLIFFYGVINPIINCYSPLCIFFYLISQLQIWKLAIPQYIMKRRRADRELFCYSALLFITILHPFGEFIHLTSLIFFFFCIITQGKKQ